MFAEHSMDILFRLLNFVWLVVLFVYIFRKYAYPVIAQKMEQEHNALTNLVRKKDLLKEQLKVTNKVLSDQELLSATLLNHVMQWQLAIREQERVEQEEHAKAVADRQKKSQKQEYYRTIYFMRDRIMQDTVSKTESLLRNKFASEQEGQRYIAQIMNHIERKQV